MKNSRISLASALVLVAFLSACETMPTQSNASGVGNAAQTPAKDTVRFVDITGFDRDLHQSLLSNQPEVTVAMYDKVSPNNTPERLQKWLNAVERNGGRVEIEPPPNELTPRNPLALISLVGGLWNAIKATADVRDAQMTQSAKGHDAVISLQRNAAGQVVIDKVIFKKNAKSPS
ncbi:MAG: hypothetical protein RLZZ24_1943 [Pseudomonadota bacterium]